MRNIARLACAFIAAAALSACNEPVPDKDLQAAKAAIAVAEAAKAEKYDPENLKAARDAFRLALKDVVADENAHARKNAVEARVKAELATENSRRLLAQETIQEAEKLLAEAKAKRAAYLAADEYNRAVSKLADAKKNFEEKKYVDAFTDAENAKEAASKAKDEADKRMQELTKAATDAGEAVKRADNDPVVKKYAATELDDAKKKLDAANENRKKVEDSSLITADNDELRNKQAREAYDKALKEFKDAEAAAGEAIRLALEREREEFRKLAEKKINEAKELMEKVKKLKEQGLIKKDAGNPAPAPETSTNTSTTNTSSTNTSTTNTTTTTSTNTSSTNTVDYSKLPDREKYEAARKALERAENTYEGRSYKNSIENSEEAIRLAKLILENMKDKTYYTVRLIPEARDCLWRIAGYSFVYNDPAMWPRLWKANKLLILDPDLIYPGQKFEIPPKQ